MASKRQKEIEARRAADPVAQALGREDIDYTSDELPTAPRLTDREWLLANVPHSPSPSLEVTLNIGRTEKHCPTCTCRN